MQVKLLHKAQARKQSDDLAGEVQKQRKEAHKRCNKFRMLAEGAAFELLTYIWALPEGCLDGAANNVALRPDVRFTSAPLQRSVVRELSTASAALAPGSSVHQTIRQPAPLTPMYPA